MSQVSINIISLDPNGHALQPCLFSGQIIEDLGFEPFSLGVPQVHSEQHLGPVLRFGAAGAGMDGQDGVSRVILLDEQHLKLCFFQVFLKRSQALLEVGFDALSLLGQFEQDFNIFLMPEESGKETDIFFQFFLFLLEGLKFLGVLPGLGVGQLFVYGLELGLFLAEVKESLSALQT